MDGQGPGQGAEGMPGLQVEELAMNRDRLARRLKRLDKELLALHHAIIKARKKLCSMRGKRGVMQGEVNDIRAYLEGK